MNPSLNNILTSSKDEIKLINKSQSKQNQNKDDNKDHYKKILKSFFEQNQTYYQNKFRLSQDDYKPNDISYKKPTSINSSLYQQSFTKKYRDYYQGIIKNQYQKKDHKNGKQNKSKKLNKISKKNQQNNQHYQKSKIEKLDKQKLYGHRLETQHKVSDQAWKNLIKSQPIFPQNNTAIFPFPFKGSSVYKNQFTTKKLQKQQSYHYDSLPKLNVTIDYQTSYQSQFKSKSPILQKIKSTKILQFQLPFSGKSQYKSQFNKKQKPKKLKQKHSLEEIQKLFFNI